jgi:hypothetical protein
LDSDIEKKSGSVITQHVAHIPKRSLSRADPYVPERLTILRRQSFEVFHENRTDKRPPSGELGIGLAITKPNDNAEKRSGRVDAHGNNLPSAGLSVPSTIPQVAPLSPFTWTESGYTSDGLPQARSARIRRSTVNSSDPHGLNPDTMRSFWVDGGDRNSVNLDPSSGLKRPDPSHALRDGEKRWDIQGNPFRDSAGSQAVEKDSSRTGGRWSDEAYKGIELKGISRSQSLNQTLGMGKPGRIL